MLLTSADIPLELILNDTVHRKMFRMLAESHMCSESVSLWERCNDFKKLVAKEAAVGPALAFNIYSNFLAPSAPKQVPVRKRKKQRKMRREEKIMHFFLCIYFFPASRQFD